MEIRESSITFPTVRGSGPQRASTTIIFPREITKAVASVRGYQIGFVGDDHHVGVLQVELDTTISANVAVVEGRLGCRDWSGNWDDNYNGSIQVTLLAELRDITAPPPRGDLVITDLEINQATQFFRSAEHLDSGNVMPDNVMPLVGGKITGLRFYVDHDASAGLPSITNLAGEVEIRSGGAVTTLTQLATIRPQRATSIDRAQADQTLNFAIPAAWCRGRVEISCTVFDAANPSSRSSAFRRVLQFVDVNPLRIYGVGVTFTGVMPNLPAPSDSALQSTFDFARKVWPTGDILSSGYTTISFGQNLAGVAADGCGSGFNALLDQIKDLKGDTDDLVYGVLPTGTPLTGVGGCGGGGAGVGMVGGQVTAAHEAGHAVGRKHAPCDSTVRCDNPANTDDDYPQYGVYVSDSIGEFGYDPASNVVHDPATQRDFMGYSGNDWISPYTYQKLFVLGDPIAPSPSRATSWSSFMAIAAFNRVPSGDKRERAEWIKRRQPLLFLSLYVNGDAVSLRPSFTFEAYLRRPGPNSDYEVHLEDGEGKMLACVQLQLACGACDSHCGPLALQGEVPWHPDAKRLIVRRNGEDIESFKVEDQPKISVSVDYGDNREIRIRWRSATGSKDLWYLVHWQDWDGSWRGVAPRTHEDHLILPPRFLWATKNKLKLRVLAVHLLHTAAEELVIDSHSEEPPQKVEVRAVGDNRYRAVAVDPLGRTTSGDDFVWYLESGGELARGSELHVKPGSRGVANVRLVGQGILAAEGYVLLNPGQNEEKCGWRPGDEKMRKIFEPSEHDQHSHDAD